MAKKKSKKKSGKLPNIFLRWRNIGPDTICELVRKLPHSVMSEEEFRKTMVEKYSTFFSNVGQAPRQWGLYYIHEGVYYPRFKRDLTLREAEIYARGVVRNFVIPNPTTRLKQLKGSINLIKAIVEYMESNPQEHDLQVIVNAICGEVVVVNDILKNALNNYSGVLEVTMPTKDKFHVELKQNYKEIMLDSYDHVLNEEEFFHHFDDILKIGNADLYKKEIELLLKKKNLVLTGAPGTGKTFAAKQIAALIVSNGQRMWEQLTSEDRKRIGFTQFHPSYDYTDFVEGLRPDEKSNFVRTDGIFKDFCKKACDVEVVFKETYDQILLDVESGDLILETDSKSIICKDGKFLVRSKDGRPAGEEKKSISKDKLLALYKHCVANSIDAKSSLTKDDATKILQNNGQETYFADSYLLLVLKELLQRSASRVSDNEVTDPYVFIIDEINRGELSKIFGELFYSIEPEYRGKEGRVTTQYANMLDDKDIFAGGFYIPKNVLILGTMNDVDRGVEAMDFAIRRRFAWHEVTADESASRMGVKGDALAKMNAINEIIKKDLGRAYCIGGSYFRKFDKEGAESTWENHLYGILYEYYRGEPRVDDKVEDIRIAFFAAKEEKESAPSSEQSEAN